MTRKKAALFSLIFLFSVTVLFAKADTDQTLALGIEIFNGTWSTDGAQADIQFLDGFFQVHIETFDCGYESTEWVYLCTYDEHKQALIASSTGNKNIYVYDFDTSCETKSTIYQNGSAVFSLHPEGYLMWLDENEGAGQDLLFTKMGDYCGTWQWNNISIDFYAIGGTYRCTVSKSEGNSIVAIWSYQCKYDLDSRNVISNSLGRKEILLGYDDEGEIYDTVYHDGSAIFSINSDGYLLWNDLKDNAGSGLLFIKNRFE